MLPYPPDLKNGSFLQIEKSLLRALNKHKGLTNHQLKIAIAIMDKTYGWGKTKDNIALSQISEMTGIQENHCATNLKKMVAMNIITREKGKYAHNLGINKFFRDWQDWDTEWEWWNKDGEPDEQENQQSTINTTIDLTAEQMSCWEWAKNHDFWHDKVATESDFLKAYKRQGNSVKSQYEAFKLNPEKPKYRGKKKPDDFEFQDFDDVTDAGNGDFINGEFERVG